MDLSFDVPCKQWNQSVMYELFNNFFKFTLDVCMSFRH